MVQPLAPTEMEVSRRIAVLEAIRKAVDANEIIKLPQFHPGKDNCRCTEENPYGGAVGPYRYQFEGEEDLLHLIVTRADGAQLSPEEGQSVAKYLLPEIPPGLIWIKPGEYSQHFFCGHDDLVAHTTWHTSKSDV